MRALPTVDLDVVWHVGTFEVSDKGSHGPSYEGAGLSVSLHPDAWVRIAKLGGLPLWTLRRDGGQFLDAHQLAGGQRAELLAWGTARGLVSRRTVWQARWFDDELDQDLTSIFDSEEEAADTSDGPPVPVEVALATGRLLTAAGHRSGPGPVDAFELLLPAWVEHRTGLDGVWWDDVLDPARLSAPRGVIVPAHVRRWSATR